MQATSQYYPYAGGYLPEYYLPSVSPLSAAGFPSIPPITEGTCLRSASALLKPAPLMPSPVSSAVPVPVATVSPLRTSFPAQAYMAPPGSMGPIGTVGPMPSMVSLQVTQLPLQGPSPVIPLSSNPTGTTTINRPQQADMGSSLQTSTGTTPTMASNTLAYSKATSISEHTNNYYSGFEMPLKRKRDTQPVQADARDPFRLAPSPKRIHLCEPPRRVMHTVRPSVAAHSRHRSQPLQQLPYYYHHFLTQQQPQLQQLQQLQQHQHPHPAPSSSFLNHRMGFSPLAAHAVPASRPLSLAMSPITVKTKPCYLDDLDFEENREESELLRREIVDVHYQKYVLH